MSTKSTSTLVQDFKIKYKENNKTYDKERWHSNVDTRTKKMSLWSRTFAEDENTDKSRCQRTRATVGWQFNTESKTSNYTITAVWLASNKLEKVVAIIMGRK